IEGHCDERGSAEYNMQLGQARAESAKSYLVQVGIASDQLGVVSYGKEKPACDNHEEGCWQKNRRIHIVAMAKPQEIIRGHAIAPMGLCRDGRFTSDNRESAGSGRGMPAMRDTAATILAVDDDSGVLALLDGALRDAGYHVLLANGGWSAISEFER